MQPCTGSGAALLAYRKPQGYARPVAAGARSCASIARNQVTKEAGRMNPILSDEEIRNYQSNGYVFPKYRLPAPLLTRLREGVDRLLERYTDVAQEDLANPHMLPPTSGPDMNPFMAAARHPAVLDMMQQIIGPDIVLWISRICNQLPCNRRRSVSLGF